MVSTKTAIVTTELSIMAWDQKNTAHYGAAAHHNERVGYATSLNQVLIKAYCQKSTNAKFYTIHVGPHGYTNKNPIPWMVDPPSFKQGSG